jgi:hypothetical protein
MTEGTRQVYAGGHPKARSWRRFVRPEGWRFRTTAHLDRRCAERHIPEDAVEAGYTLADLTIPLAGGRRKLGLSRRAIRRAAHDRALAARLRHLARLVLVVTGDGRVMTAWLDHPRRPHPRRGLPPLEEVTP